MSTMSSTSRITLDTVSSLNLTNERSTSRTIPAGTPDVPSQESGQIS